MRTADLSVNDTVTIDGWSGTYRITAIDDDTNEVRVAPLSTWVSADRAALVEGEPDLIHLVVGGPNDAWLSCDPVGDRVRVPLTQRTRDRAKATCADCLSAADLVERSHRGLDGGRSPLGLAVELAAAEQEKSDNGAFYYEHIANGHRRKAAAADTPAERDHWLLEAERFEELASMARIDPAAARRAYRPTRSYES